MIDDGYEAFADVVTLCIELIRQFYTLPRQFRLLGENGEEFVDYHSAGLQMQTLRDGLGNPYYRVPEFDLEIDAQEENPYQTMEHNQLALQLFGMGFFRSDLADQALRCLSLMDFKNKDAVVNAIQSGAQQSAEIASLREKLLAIAAVVDREKGTALVQSLQQEFGASGGSAGEIKRDAMEQQRRKTQLAVHPR